MPRTWGLRLLIALVLCPALTRATEFTPDEAPSHVGETATVCGTVALADYAMRSRGQPTFLNLDKPYPHQAFTALIWGSDRHSFGTPETSLLGKRVCATGIIKLYRGVPEIILRTPNQLTTQ